MDEKQKPTGPSEAAVEHEIKRNRPRAEDYLRDPDKSKQLLDEAVKKANSKEEKKGPLEEIWNSFKALFRLFQAYIHHDYTQIPWGSIVLITVAILYFVMPLDLLPDWIPFVGFVDDAAVIAFVLKQVNNDLNRFLKWEAIQKSLDAVTDSDSSN